MHLTELLHKNFADKLPHIHKIRLKNLMTVCEAAISNNKLYLTGLGRAISNTNKECSNIQKVDRLLGNGSLQAERVSFYKIMILNIIKENSSPLIHIDWTCLNHATHKSFLSKLKTLVPQSAKPIIVTDAGFRAPWFAYILELGWDFVGRLRNKNAVHMEGSSSWCLSSTYFEQATLKPAYLGFGRLTEAREVPTHFVL